MVRRVIELILILVAGLGGYRAWETGRERARLEKEVDRLTREIGELPVGDPSKVLIRALETGEPLHFAWNVHLPAKYNVDLQHFPGGPGFRGGHGFSSFASEPVDFTARVRIREADDGRGGLQVYSNFHELDGQFRIGGPPLAEALHGRWGEILVERAGFPGTAVIEPDKPAVLLRLTLPKGLLAEVREKIPGSFRGSPDLLESILDAPVKH